MSNTPVDPDIFTAPFQLTRGIHRGVYDTVNPSKPGLRAAGKFVVITGAGGGLEYVCLVSMYLPASRTNLVANRS